MHLLEIRAVMVLRNDLFRRLFVEFQGFAQALRRLRQDRREGGDDKESPCPRRDCPPQQIGGDSSGLSDADWAFAGRHRRVGLTMTAGIIEIHAIAVALSLERTEARHVIIERGQALLPTGGRCRRRLGMTIKGSGVGVIGIHEAGQREPECQAMRALTGHRSALAAIGRVITKQVSQSLIGVLLLLLVTFPWCIIVASPAQLSNLIRIPPPVREVERKTREAGRMVSMDNPGRGPGSVLQ